LSDRGPDVSHAFDAAIAKLFAFKRGKVFWYTPTLSPTLLEQDLSYRQDCARLLGQFRLRPESKAQSQMQTLWIFIALLDKRIYIYMMKIIQIKPGTVYVHSTVGFFVRVEFFFSFIV